MLVVRTMASCNKTINALCYGQRLLRLLKEALCACARTRTHTHWSDQVSVFISVIEHWLIHLPQRLCNNCHARTDKWFFIVQEEARVQPALESRTKKYRYGNYFASFSVQDSEQTSLNVLAMLQIGYIFGCRYVTLRGSYTCGNGWKSVTFQNPTLVKQQRRKIPYCLVTISV